MANKFGNYGQVDDSQCNMNCNLEPELKCGGGWRNSVYSVKEFNPEEKRVTQAKQINDSFKSIIKDIDNAR